MYHLFGGGLLEAPGVVLAELDVLSADNSVMEWMI
jgi:hypothetical protein